MALDSDTCRRALNRAHRRLVNDIKPKEVLDLLERNGLLGYEQIKDIRGLLTSSMQNRILLSKISQKGVEGYKIFKECLAESDQKELKKLLDEIEEELYREKNRAETIQEERQRMLKKRELDEAIGNARGLRSASTLEKLDKVPSDRELVSIAPSIGSGWELLAAMLDVKRPAVERIKLDHGYSSVEQIYNMLQHWKQRKANNATFRALLSEMKECTAVTIDWEELREKIGFGVEVLYPEPQPMETETQNQQVQMIYQRVRVSRPSGLPGVGALPMEPRSGEGEGEPMDTSQPFGAENPQTHIDVDGQSVEDGRFENAPDIPHQNEPHFGSTRLMQPTTDSTTLEELSQSFVQIIKRDLFDGRLLSLNELQMKEIKKMSSIQVLAQPSGAQVFATKQDVPGFNTKLVIKQLYIDKNDLDRMRSITNEKLASRILHFGIVPLLAYHDALMTDQSVRYGYYYFVSPYFEGGDLLTAIKEDRDALFGNKQENALVGNKPDNVRMWHKTRLKIIYQVASAISYLHTPVKDFRNDFLHMDIKSPNIVLDLNNNARLIDFGLAREMKEPNASLLITASPLDGTFGYFPTTRFEGLTKFHDLHNFGIVIRELLTGLSPVERIADCTLRTMSTFMLRDKIEKKIWKKKTLSVALLALAGRCVESLRQHAAANTFQISDMLKELDILMREEGAKRWNRNLESEKCEVCVVNNAVKESEFLEHEKMCQVEIKVCASCMRNSFLNPIICHTCEKKLQPFIGENWGAILIAGNDKNESVAESFKKDVDRLSDVITSRSVPVMCIRKESIIAIKPSFEDNMWRKIQDAFEELNKQKIQTLIVAYSGHHGFPTIKAEGSKADQSMSGVDGSESENSVRADTHQKEGVFKLSENESMKDVDLCNEIMKLATVDKVLLFEDCCHGDAVIHALKGKTVVQFNSSTTTTTSSVDFRKKESRYIAALIKALTATDDTRCKLNQHQNCSSCTKIADELFKGNFLTLETLHTFLSGYIKHGCENTGILNIGRPAFAAHNLSAKDCILAYRYHFKVAIQIKIKKTKGGKEKLEYISLNEYGDMQELKKKLFKELIEDDENAWYFFENENQLTDYAAAVSIQVELGPREIHLKEIDSLEQAASAWIARKELIARIRNVAKIDFKNYDVADINDSTEDIFENVYSLPRQFCTCIRSEGSKRITVDGTCLERCVTKIEELYNASENLKKVLFDFNQSLDHIHTVLRNKHEDVSNVKVRIDFPTKNIENVEKFAPFIYYHLERELP